VDWDNEGGIKPSGTYTFSGGIDLGASFYPVRLVSKITATVTNAKDLIDDRSVPIDEWEDFDGVSAGDAADAQVWVRWTDDDPTGTPTWSSWQRLDVGEYNHRAFEFQARLTSADSAYNIEITELTVTAERVV
jgi:hypothetical protein